MQCTEILVKTAAEISLVILQNMHYTVMLAETAAEISHLII